MKKLILPFVLILCGTCTLNAQDQKEEPAFEIVKYYFVELITNPDRPELPKQQVDSIQAAHMANMDVMVKAKQLMLAGPFDGGGGLFILKLGSMEEAEKLVAKDPAVSAGRLKTKIRAWYTTTGSFVAEEKYKENQPKN